MWMLGLRSRLRKMRPAAGAAFWIVLHDRRRLKPTEQLVFSQWIAIEVNARAYRTALYTWTALERAASSDGRIQDAALLTTD